MSSIDLTQSQQTILQALVDLSRENDTSGAVKGERIAEVMDRTPGTIRNQMQSLKALQLVEGVPGPKGGYKPTSSAYQALDIQTIDDAADVAFEYDGESRPDIVVQEINLTSVHHPDLCRAEVRLQGSVTDYRRGDAVAVGPTPLSKLRIEGAIEAIDTTDNRLVLTIDDMRAPVTDEADY